MSTCDAFTSTALALIWLPTAMKKEPPAVPACSIRVQWPDTFTCTPGPMWMLRAEKTQREV